MIKKSKERIRLTPSQAIRKFCIQCVGTYQQVPTCGGNKIPEGFGHKGECFFYQYRMKKGRPSVKLIRRMCLECQGKSAYWVKHCQDAECPLYEFRFGKNPKYSEEYRQKRREQMIQLQKQGKL